MKKILNKRQSLSVEENYKEKDNERLERNNRYDSKRTQHRTDSFPSNIHIRFNYSRNMNISRMKQSYVGKAQRKSENENVHKAATKATRNSPFLYIHPSVCVCLSVCICPCLCISPPCLCSCSPF